MGQLLEPREVAADVALHDACRPVLAAREDPVARRAEERTGERSGIPLKIEDELSRSRIPEPGRELARRDHPAAVRTERGIRWRFHADEVISGAASVVDGLVYFSTFGEHTYALHAADGRVAKTWADGKYSPVVADATHLYLVGLGRLYALTPR